MSVYLAGAGWMLIAGPYAAAFVVFFVALGRGYPPEKMRAVAAGLRPYHRACRLVSAFAFAGACAAAADGGHRWQAVCTGVLALWRLWRWAGAHGPGSGRGRRDTVRITSRVADTGGRLTVVPA